MNAQPPLPLDKKRKRPEELQSAGKKRKRNEVNGNGGATPSTASKSSADLMVDVRLCIETMIRHSSDICRMLETWPNQQILLNALSRDKPGTEITPQLLDVYMKRYQNKLVEKFMKLSKKNRNLAALVQKADFSLSELPVDFVSHIDLYGSPHNWLQGLFEEVRMQNDAARGEAEALGKAYTTLSSMLKMDDNKSDILDLLGGIRNVMPAPSTDHEVSSADWRNDNKTATNPMIISP